MLVSGAVTALSRERSASSAFLHARDSSRTCGFLLSVSLERSCVHACVRACARVSRDQSLNTDGRRSRRGKCEEKRIYASAYRYIRTSEERKRGERPPRLKRKFLLFRLCEPTHVLLCSRVAKMQRGSSGHDDDSARLPSPGHRRNYLTFLIFSFSSAASRFTPQWSFRSFHNACDRCHSDKKIT